MATLTELDQDYIDGTITNAESKIKPNDYGWLITFTEEKDAEYEMGFYISQPIDAQWKPEVGDTIRVYGFGHGEPVRGVFINGHKIFYFSDREWELMAQRRILERLLDRIDSDLGEIREQRNSN